VRNGFIKPLADSLPPDEKNDDLSEVTLRAMRGPLADIKRAVRAIEAQIGLGTTADEV
jgi:hypothetical protein